MLCGLFGVGGHRTGLRGAAHAISRSGCPAAHLADRRRPAGLASLGSFDGIAEPERTEVVDRSKPFSD